MPPEQPETEVQLEIGHVLFIDIVGYSKALIDDQRALQQDLNDVVRNTEQFRAAESAGKLIRLPTGDGMALVFFTTPEAPLQCAMQIADALKSHPQLRVRMGINTGPVSGIADVNDRSNVAGAGINIAQRVWIWAMPVTSCFPNAPPKICRSTADGNRTFTRSAKSK